MQGTSLYLQRSSGLDKLYPLSKLALAAFFVVAAAALPDARGVLAAILFVLLPIAAWGRILLPLLRSIFWVMLPFTISLGLIQGFFSPGSTVLLALGPFTFTLEGLLSGLDVAARILLALGGTLLLMLSTRPDHLMLALRQRGLPESLAYIVLAALQIFPRFQDRARVILDAQRSRGLETEVNFFQRFSLLVPLVGPLILGSIVEVEERAMALEARGFNHPGPKTSWIRLQDSRPQAWLRMGLALLMLALVALRIARAQFP